MEEDKGTILIVDDEEAIRGILTRKLASDGYKCETANDGKEALWKAFMRDYDLILMDIKMPSISGMEALPQIVTHHPDTCVIMMTAVVDTETAVQALKLGAYDYVTKPFDLDDLGLRIDKALERRKLILENRDQQLRLEQKVQQQALQLHEYYRKAVETLVSEQLALENSSTESTSKLVQGKPGAEVGNKTPGSSGPIGDLANKLSQLFSKGVPDLLEENADAVSLGKRTSSEISLVGIVSEKDENPVLYNGSVELSFSRPVNLQQILQFYNTLKYVRQVGVVDVVGLVEKEVTIKLLLENPTPLTKILKVLPEVEDVSEEPRNSEDETSGSQEETPPVKKIVIGLAAKNSGAATSNPEVQNLVKSDLQK
mgnify:FL=1